MLDDISAKQMMATGSMTPPQRQRYTVITSPITPVTPRNDDGLNNYFEGVPASSLQEDFVDFWLLVGSGQRDGRVKDIQASSSNNAPPVEQHVVSSEGRDGMSCRTDPVCSAKKLPVKRKLGLSSDESAEKNIDSSLVEKTSSRDSSYKKHCKENVDPSNGVALQAPTLSKNYNENKDVCVSQPISVPATQTTAAVQPGTTCSVSVDQNNRRGFQPYVPMSLHSPADGQVALPSCSKGGNQDKSHPNNPDRVIPEMFNTNNTTDTTRFYDYSSFYNGSFYPYQTGTWNPYNTYNPTMFTPGMPQGSQHTPMYPHLYNGTYQTTSTSGNTVPSQNYGTVLYTQSPVSSAMLPELSQFMNTGGHYKGNVHQSHSSNSSFTAGAQGYQNPYYYNTYAGTGSNNTGTFQN